ncbi:MAG: S8 family serine peptidase [Lachnospiraceae bacterium]|nr:S8 family serine peptidase [Lachnospiraceae bacterium]
MLKKSLAAILAASLVLSQTGTAIAASVSQTTVSQEKAYAGDPLSDGKNTVPDSAVLSGNEMVSEQSAGREETAASTPYETVSEDTAESIGGAYENGTAAETAQPSGNKAGEQTSELSENTAEEEISEAVKLASLNEAEAGMYNDFAALKVSEADETYDADEAFFETESREEAEKIAGMYGAELVSYEYGIAVIRFSLNEEGLAGSVLDGMYSANMAGGDSLISQVEIYPNYINHIYEEPSSQIYTDDPGYSRQWYHQTIGDEEAWRGSDKGNGVTVAVIDTGIDTDHEDLKDNLEGAYETLSDEDSVEDEHSHGTHCSGIIAAVENNVGGVGVAPKAKIISIRAGNASGQLKTSDSIAAMKLATELGVNVISMSFGRTAGTIAAEKSALQAAVNNGITLIAAAGNETTDIMSYPAGYDNVIAVASTDSSDGLSSFSNYGNWVSIAAPGSDIYSTVLNGGYGTKSGTSMACPVVAGVAALVYAANEDLVLNRNADTVGKVTDILLNSANGKTYSYGGHSVKGGVDAAGAVEYTKKDKADESVTVDIPQKPVIALEADKKTGAVTVSVTGEEGCELHYTTDGSDPVLKSSTVSGSFILSDEGSYTVKAIAVNKAALNNGGYKYASSEVTVAKVTVKVPAKADYEDKELSVIPDAGSEISVALGKSVKLTGTVSPNNSSRKTIVFEKTEGADSITVNANGQVKVASDAGSADTAKVKLSVKDCPDAGTAEVTVSVKSSTVSNVSSSYGNKVQELWTKAVTASMSETLDATKGLTPAFDSGTAYSFKSSNVKVARVDNKGNVRAVGNGNATITVTAMDGSNKSAKIKVKCMTPVTSISLNSNAGASGSSKISAGKSITLKPVFYGVNNLKPSNTKVKWSLKSGSSSGITVTKNGKVSCAKGAVTGKTATVVCTAEDGSKVSAEYKVTVKDLTKYMGVLNGVSYKYYKKGGYYIFTNKYAASRTSAVTAGTGKEIDLTDPSGFLNGYKLVCAEKNSYRVRYSYYDGFTNIDEDPTTLMNADEYIISVGRSKNMLVTETDESGSVQKISIARPGTYTITYKATDGSNKKFTMKLKVK